MHGNGEKENMDRDMGINGHSGSDGHRGSMSRSMGVPMPSVLSSIPKGEIVGKWVVIDVKTQWLSLMSTYLTCVFREVSKVVSLWNKSKHFPHGNSSLKKYERSSRGVVMNLDFFKRKRTYRTV
jgi:hypothetical protein